MIKPSFKAAHSLAPTSQGVASPFARFETPLPGNQESAADRILLTLLALGLMLLAFFVVLTSASTFDQRRMRDVAQSVQTASVPSKDEVVAESAAVDATLMAAVNVLRSAVSDVFAGILPRDDASLSQDKNRDRVEIDVPFSVFFADNEAILFPLPLLDKLVAVLSAPPAGYRMELVVRAAGKTSGSALDLARLAALADGLVGRGLPTTALSVGTLQNAADTGARSLRFTFLLLNADDDLAAVRMMTGEGGAMTLIPGMYGLPNPNAGSLVPSQPRTLWLITIVDLVTLLLAFFVLMFSMSHVETKKYAELVKSYGEAFNPTGATAPAAPRVRMAKIANVSGDDLGYLEAVLKAAFAGTATLKDVQFQRTSQYLILSLPVDGVFAPGSGSFSDSAAAPVFDLGGVLSNLKNRIAVVGNAVITSSEDGAAAWSLAVARAQAMADALKTSGYDQSITVLGRGGEATDVAAAIGRIDILIMPERPAS